MHRKETERGSFLDEWRDAKDSQHLKELLLRDEHMLAVRVSKEGRTSGLIGQAVRDVPMPEDVLIALIRRDERMLVPRGGTVLREDDRLTVIGDPVAIKELRARYGSGR